MPDVPRRPTDPDEERVLESLDLRDAMIAGLAAGANDLAEAARGLVQAARLTRLEKFVALSLLTVNTVGMVLIGLATVVVLRLQTGGDEQREQIAEVISEIESCTTPGGRCYEQGGERTAAAVHRLLQTQVIVAQCQVISNRATTPVTEAQFEACVADRVARLPLD